jgi:[acyl-carrier-protein] S-malonyltransferase
MTLRWAILCSGQGGQQAAMLDLLHGDALAWRVWQQALVGLGGDADAVTLPPALAPVARSTVEIARTGSDPTLAFWQARLSDPDWCYANRHAQALIVAYQLAIWQALAPRLPQPTLVAGYSVGEIGAQLWAGSIAPERIMPLTMQRSELMDRAAHGVAQGLLALSGVWQRSPDWQALLDAHQAALAIDNGNMSCVLGAPASQLDTLAEQLRQRGAQVQSLKVRVASHTPLMQAAYAPWLAYLNTLDWNKPKSTLLAGCDGSRLTRAAAIAPALARQMVAPVRWAACMDSLAEAGIERVLETGPGSALARMLQARCPDLATRSLADFRSLDAAVAWLERQ